MCVRFDMIRFDVMLFLYCFGSLMPLFHSFTVVVDIIVAVVVAAAPRNLNTSSLTLMM